MIEKCPFCEGNGTLPALHTYEDKEFGVKFTMHTKLTCPNCVGTGHVKAITCQEKFKDGSPSMRFAPVIQIA